VSKTEITRTVVAVVEVNSVALGDRISAPSTSRTGRVADHPPADRLM
jgi:hypothetical protein